MGLTVTVLGCDASYPSPGGACSGYLVESGRTRLWLDAGTGTMAALSPEQLESIDGIVLTHAHPDHWTDVLVFHHLVKYYRPRDAIPVWSPARVQELVRAVNGDDLAPLAWAVIDATSRVTCGDLSLSFSRTDHGPETLAVRLDGGGVSVAYSADTGPGWAMSSLGDGLGLALIEATLDAAHEGVVQHLSGRQAGLMAEEAGARALVLTHIDPDVSGTEQLEAAKTTFRGPVSLATPGARYEVQP
ncbi:MAG TPA: MBL fold metallo-hydrolase [Acidimicrobiales bacterium]|nr:MBL fold metallo-hydrolase [Acidimicrobiales bacterium]